jgi:plasmid stabilization system protein ParE
MIMQVEYNAKAIKHISSTFDYYLKNYGKQATKNLAIAIDEKVNKLMRFPEMGFPEPLLQDRRFLYRSILIDKNHKLVYYIKGETIRIAALWDMRMHPQRLRRKI